jgi:hypothetical protein
VLLGLHIEKFLSAAIQSHHVQTRACRLTSYKVLKGLDWLELQQVSTQLTSLTLNYSCTLPDEHPDRQGSAQMLAGLVQFSELRHLDTGNCNFVPADGALCLLLPSYVVREEGVNSKTFSACGLNKVMLESIQDQWIHFVCRVRCLLPAVGAAQADIAGGWRARHVPPAGHAASAASTEMPEVHRGIVPH